MTGKGGWTLDDQSDASWQTTGNGVVPDVNLDSGNTHSLAATSIDWSLPWKIEFHLTFTNAVTAENLFVLAIGDHDAAFVELDIDNGNGIDNPGEVHVELIKAGGNHVDEIITGIPNNVALPVTLNFDGTTTVCRINGQVAFTTNLAFFGAPLAKSISILSLSSDFISGLLLQTLVIRQ